MEVHPHRKGASFYSSVDKIGGTEQKTAPAPNLSTEQPGPSDTLIKPILKQKKWMRGEKVNQEYLRPDSNDSSLVRLRS